MSDDFRRMQAVLATVAAHLDQDLGLEVLAAQACLSPFHLQRLFSATMGETPKQLTLRLRLGRAAVQLLTTDTTVLDIALDCGFQSHEAFTRAFGKRFGISPAAYRARGFVTPGDGKTHAAVVEHFGPCVGLYRMSQIKRKETKMTHPITTKQIARQPVLVVQRKIPRTEIASAIQSGLQAIGKYAQGKGIAFAGAPFARYLEMGPGLITMEAGMPIGGPHETVLNEGGVAASALTGGLVATTIHQGHYDQLAESWAAMHQWIEANGHQPGDGFPWESYITDPGQIPDPKDWKTELFWPLRA